jgi:3-isopropylmalate/(R)-2-methylmalate dehydratase small subunit
MENERERGGKIMTSSFAKVTGTVAPLDVANVDTDAIIPKQFLKRIERTGFGQFLFYDWRFEGEKLKEDFVLNKAEYREAPILLARKNFGCGSSREHAPWAINDFGIQVIIAPSYADIFYNNCFKNKVLPIVLSEEEVEQLFQKTNESGYQLTIDLENQKVVDNAGFQAEFGVDEYRKQLLLQGLDEVGATLQFEENINSFEKSHKIYYQLEK